MNNTAYHFELHDILTNFVAAFDDTRIKRFDKNRNAKEIIEVRYVLGPKQRVMYDIVNGDHNLTLPVVACDVASLKLDTNRMQNKHANTYIPAANSNNGRVINKIPTPTPILLTINMSILARFKADIDQIISNFVAYTNPYIVLSWPVPSGYGGASVQEIRSHVNWSGDINFETPLDIAYAEKFRIIGNTSFTVEAFLFRDVQDPESIIYKVSNAFTIANSLDSRISTIDDYSSLSAINTTETVVISAIPEITNVFYSTTGAQFPVYDNLTLKRVEPNNFILFGKRFNYTNSFYLSSNVTNFYSNFEQINTAKSSVISAYKLPQQYFTVVSDNIVTLTIPPSTLQNTGNFTFVTANSAGWDSSYSASSSLFTLT